MIFLRLLLVTLATAVSAQQCLHAENLVLQGSVSQSGTIHSATLANDGDSRHAQKEGGYAQCSTTKPDYDYYPWWQVNLQDSLFMVTNVEIYAPDANFIVGVGYNKLQNNEEIFTKPSDISLCEVGTRNEENGRIDAFCGLSGQYLTIINQNAYSTLSLCEVEIYGENRTNIALGKQTVQSSEVYNAVSSLAVDGKYSETFYSEDGDTFTPVCTHTSGDIDRFPWWRVDLENLFIVKSVNIYNRGEGFHSRLHDIEIRVGMFDIAKVSKLLAVVGDLLFTDNLLCASTKGDSLNGGKNKIFCSQPTLGRYVSIQIVKFCDWIDCSFTGAGAKNILTLCEVEVFGQKVDFDLDDGQYLSLGKPIVTSFDNSEEYDDDDEYSWLSIDLQSTDVIYFIEVERDIESTDFKMPSVEVRVGNEHISSKYNNKHFTKNHLCVPWQPLFEKLELLCYNAVMGRYVTFQFKHCSESNCMDKEMIRHVIKDIKVWGISKTEYRSSLNVAPFKPTTQSSIKDSGISSLAINKIIPDMNSDHVKCALTAAKDYPWWRVDLKAPHRVLYVSIDVPSNTNVMYLSL